MKRIFKFLIKSFIYCFIYVASVNLSASYVNDTLETTTASEIISINAMISGQRDIYTFLEYKIKDIDVKSLREEVLKEIKKI
jgi:hypothetical protein